MTSRRNLTLGSAAALLTTACGGMRARAIDVPGAVVSDWPLAAPERQAIDASALGRALDDGAALPALRGLVVVRNGMLVGERYYNGAASGDLLAIHSATKSVTSMLVGQALQQGVLPSLSATVGQLLPEAAARAPGSAVTRLTLQQILAGRTGLVYDWRTQTTTLARTDDPLGMTLALAADPAAGPAWSYNDAAVNLLAPILSRAHGRDLADVAARDLFAPLGIERFRWQRDGSGGVTAYGGLMLRTRDLARLAWTMVDAGRWRGAQVVPAAWVAESTRSRGPADWRVSPVTDIGYGDLWFTGLLHGRRMAWGWGYGAQFAVLVPELRLAVATAASAPPINDLGTQNNAVMALVARVVRATAEAPRAGLG
ncbi:MAG: serine hydrolase [Variovorax sp.]